MKFDEFIEEYELEDCANYIRPHVQPCVGFSLRAADRPPTLGSSRVGGGPDLPPDFVVPTNQGRPLDFVMQVNLEEAAPYDRAQFLPKTGLLTFLWDLKNQPPSYDPQQLTGFKVLYFPTGTRLVRRPAEPNGLAPVFQLPELTVSFRQTWSVPHPNSNLGERIDEQLSEVDLELGDQYYEFCKAICLQNAPAGQRSLHQLGGHSHNVQGDMQLYAEMVSHGLNYGTGDAFDDPRCDDLKATCEGWKLLLQLDSDEKIFFGDSGMLYYWIQSADLNNRDFDRVWMTEQSC
jgi:uncharacterized protein YwqG